MHLIFAECPFKHTAKSTNDYQINFFSVLSLQCNHAKWWKEMQTITVDFKGGKKSQYSGS